MKTLKQIQEENRKFIIMANNPTAKTYEEALEMELSFGCELLVNDNILCYVNEDPVYNDEKPIFNKYILEEVREISTGRFTKIDKFKLIGCDNLRDFKDVKIIGKPLTLNRILIAFKSMEPWFLDKSLFLFDNEIFYISSNRDFNYRTKICQWDLTKETLKEQSEETQRYVYIAKINKLINEI